MSQKILTYTAAGLSLVTTPVWAQEFYVGAAITNGTAELTHGGGTDNVDLSPTEIFGGVRFETESKLFFGVELQRSTGENGGYGNFGTLDGVSSYQGELHLGYDVGQVRVFGFVGTGASNLAEQTGEIDSAKINYVYGIGADIPLNESLSLRVESELTDMTVDDNCCGYFEDVPRKDVSVGVIFSF